MGVKLGKVALLMKDPFKKPGVLPKPKKHFNCQNGRRQRIQEIQNV